MAQGGAAPGPRRFQLCTIDPAHDIGHGNGDKKGMLVLSRSNEFFQLSWVEPSGSVPARADPAQPQITDDDPRWCEGGQRFRMDCGKVGILELRKESQLIIHGSEERRGTREFRYEKGEFMSVCELVETLLTQGIAVPSPMYPYALQFYKRCHRGVYAYTPPHIQLSYQEADADNVSEELLMGLWTAVHDFFLKLVTHLDTSQTLPRDPMFPLAEAARAAHLRVSRGIDEYIRGLPSYRQVTAADFDEKGALKDARYFRERLFHAGCERSALARALPAMFEMFPEGADVEATMSELENEFKLLEEQLESLSEDQKEANKRISAAMRVIQHDVSRTDRQLPAFRKQDGKGLWMVKRLLQIYCVYNPAIGYLQGMNDLSVPFLLAFVDWREDGEPEDPKWKDQLPMVFWCLDAMLRNIDHLQLLENVTVRCKALALRVFKILEAVTPLAALWIRRGGIQELLWCYSDFVLLFKRSFADIWKVWLKLNSSPRPVEWLAYFVAAIFVQGFDKLAQVKEVSITTMMDAFPKILTELDIDQVGATSLWLAQKVPDGMQPTSGNPAPAIARQFRFFECEWTGPCAVRLEAQGGGEPAREEARREVGELALGAEGEGQA